MVTKRTISETGIVRWRAGEYSAAMITTTGVRSRDGCQHLVLIALLVTLAIENEQHVWRTRVNQHGSVGPARLAARTLAPWRFGCHRRPQAVPNRLRWAETFQHWS
jgi:hypothetical protein